MSELTERSITVKLHWMLRGSTDLMIPRYTPVNWWECDLWRLSKSGRVDEYEIKLSLPDFRADFKKNDNPYFLRPGESVRNKHQLLHETDEGPNRFWFVVSSQIVEDIKPLLPEYAGLIECRRYGAYVAVKAPLRHKRKWEGPRDQILKTCYHRFWNLECSATGHTVEPFTLIPEDAEVVS
jgi:hypothetical protein